MNLLLVLGVWLAAAVLVAMVFVTGFRIGFQAGWLERAELEADLQKPLDPYRWRVTESEP